MDINRLHYFCTVAQVGSLVRASELLGISQPALSKSIKTLEAELGHKIMIPAGRGVALTDYGWSLVGAAQPLVEQVLALKNSVFTKPARPVLRFSTFEVFSTYFLGKLIATEFPAVDIQVLEHIPGPMEESISLKQADIGITYLPVPRSDLDILKVGSIEMGIYGSKKTFDHLSFDELPFVIPHGKVSGTPSKVRGLDGWPEDERPRNVKYQVGMMETALDLCRRGLSVGYFPSFVVELHNEKVVASSRLEKLKNPSGVKSKKQDVFLIKRKSDVEDANFKKIARALRMLR